MNKIKDKLQQYRLNRNRSLIEDVEIFKKEEPSCEKGKRDPNCEDKWHVKGNPDTDTCPTCGMGFAKD